MGDGTAARARLCAGSFLISVVVFPILLPAVTRFAFDVSSRLTRNAGEAMTTRYSLLLVTLAYAAGSSAQSSAERMAELVQAWVGHSRTDLIATWGEGTVSVAESSSNVVYTYYGESRGSTIHTGQLGLSTGSGACAVSFELESGVIIAASWTTEGTRDRDKSRRTCWREFRRNEPPATTR